MTSILLISSPSFESATAAAAATSTTSPRVLLPATPNNPELRTAAARNDDDHDDDDRHQPPAPVGGGGVGSVDCAAAGAADALFSSSSSSETDSSEADDLAPKEFICPLTLSVMIDPVLTRHGHSYEREAIMQWIARDTGLCPMTRKPLRLSDMITNHHLRAQIHRWRRENDLNIRLIVTPNDMHNIFGYLDIPTDHHQYHHQHQNRNQQHRHRHAANHPVVLDLTEHSEDDPELIQEIRRPRQRPTAATATMGRRPQQQPSGGGGGLLRRLLRGNRGAVAAAAAATVTTEERA
jgi:U-box domain